jgi:hypothetical protein
MVRGDYKPTETDGKKQAPAKQSTSAEKEDITVQQ